MLVAQVYGLGNVDLHRLQAMRRLTDICSEATGGATMPHLADLRNLVRKASHHDHGRQTSVFGVREMLRLVESIKWRGEAVTWADLQREWQGVAALVPFGTEWAVYNAGAGAAARSSTKACAIWQKSTSADGSRRPANSVAALVDGYDAIVEQLRRAPEGTRGVVVISRDPGGAELAVDVIHVAGHVVFVDVARGTLAELPVSPHFLQFLRVPAEQGAGASVDNLHATPGADDTGVG